MMDLSTNQLRRIELPTETLLLVGVFSWPTSEGARRRDVIRRRCPLSSVSGPAARRFIMPATGNPTTSKGQHSDVLYFALPQIDWKAASTTIAKYLLMNRFLREAVRSTASFVGRADDDALFNASSIAWQLASLPGSARLVYGSTKQFYMWDRSSMTATCFAWSPRRAQLRQREQRGGAHHPCLANFTGPFLSTHGPLVIYSRALAHDLATTPALQEDEVFVLSRWWNSSQHSAMDGVAYRPGHPNHPASTSTFREDVYYSALVHLSATKQRLFFIDVPLSEYGYEPKNGNWNATKFKHDPSRKPLRGAVIYHRLSSNHRLAVSGLLNPNSTQLQTPTKLELSCEGCEHINTEHVMSLTMHVVCRSVSSIYKRYMLNSVPDWNEWHLCQHRAIIPRHRRGSRAIRSRARGPVDASTNSCTARCLNATT